VTGRSSGIGRATAHVFVRESAKVVIATRNAECGEQVVQEMRQLRGDALFVLTDVSKPDQL
jgi:NAD(P)-dependent dehydrogenase (short-subunit alcohol dehydrogenase family)